MRLVVVNVAVVVKVKVVVTVVRSWESRRFRVYSLGFRL